MSLEELFCECVQPTESVEDEPWKENEAIALLWRFCQNDLQGDSHSVIIQPPVQAVCCCFWLLALFCPATLSSLRTAPDMFVDEPCVPVRQWLCTFVID